MNFMNHSEARRLVSAGREAPIRGLHRLADRRRGLDFAAYLGIWAAGAAISCLAWSRLEGAPRLALSGLGWLLSGAALNANILLVHEGMHGVLLSRRGPNRWMGVFFGLSVLMSFTAYQIQHLRHHAFLGKPGDPDEYNNYARPGWKLWALHCVRIAFGSILYIFFIPALSWRKAKSGEKARMLQEYGLLLALLAALLGVAPSWILIQAWGLPLLVVNFMMNSRGLTQHSLAEPRDAFLASRNIRSGAFVRFFLLQENYHLAHHLYPHVPSYRLHALNELLKDRYPREVSGPGFFWFVTRFFGALWRRDESPIGVLRHR
jgi:fatty acid desaturase